MKDDLAQARAGPSEGGSDNMVTAFVVDAAPEHCGQPSHRELHSEQDGEQDSDGGARHLHVGVCRR